MLKVKIPEQEFFNEETQRFMYIKGAELQLEHSLISLAKWESKWHVPFLGKSDKTEEELQDYIRCMTLNKNVDQEVYRYIPPSILKEIFDYIEDPMTATWFSTTDSQSGGVRKRETITAEIIYYWMVTLGIPVQFEKWHLNRLLTLIRVVNAKNTPSKKMSKKDIYANNHKLNMARRAKHRSRG